MCDVNGGKLRHSTDRPRSRLFIAMLDDPNAEPNAPLKAAAEQYEQEVDSPIKCSPKTAGPCEIEKVCREQLSG